MAVIAADVEREANEKRADMFALSRHRIETFVQKTKEEAILKAEDTIELEVFKLKKIQQEELARYKHEAKKKIWRKREELLDNLYTLVYKRLEEYVKTKDYQEWLYKKLEEETDKKAGIIIALSQNDFENMKAGFLNAVANDDISIGGYKLIMPDSKKMVDNTINSKLTEHFDNFRDVWVQAINVTI